MAQLLLPHDHDSGASDASLAKLHARLQQTEEFQTAARLFQQLGDPTRLRIFWLLCHYRTCVTNISALLGMSAPAVSHHLRPLKSSGLIIGQRAGKEVYYQSAQTVQAQLLHRMLEQVMEITCPGGARV